MKTKFVENEKRVLKKKTSNLKKKKKRKEEEKKGKLVSDEKILNKPTRPRQQAPKK